MKKCIGHRKQGFSTSWHGRGLHSALLTGKSSAAIDCIKQWRMKKNKNKKWKYIFH